VVALTGQPIDPAGFAPDGGKDLSQGLKSVRENRKERIHSAPGKALPSGAKALINTAIYGTAEQAAEKVSAWTESFPQWLKPHSLPSEYGRAEARPLQVGKTYPRG
jgi:hypothetical protein